MCKQIAKLADLCCCTSFGVCEALKAMVICRGRIAFIFCCPLNLWWLQERALSVLLKSWLTALFMSKLSNEAINYTWMFSAWQICALKHRIPLLNLKTFQKAYGYLLTLIVVSSGLYILVLKYEGSVISECTKTWQIARIKEIKVQQRKIAKIHAHRKWHFSVHK